MADADISNPEKLLDSLHKLKAQQDMSNGHSTSPPGTSTGQSLPEKDTEQQVLYPRTPHSHDGYGFRTSGISTPLNPEQTDSGLTRRRLDELVPDPNGLGWPGDHL
jgi:GTP cyclohydrolase I